MRAILRAAVVGALLCVAVPRPASAQEIAGTVRAADDGDPVRGAVVMVLDSMGGMLHRAIAGMDGQFRIGYVTGAARLRVISIGFRPLERPLDSPAVERAPLDLRMTRIAVLLQGIRVSKHAICGGSAGHDEAVLELWEQARAALLASVVARTAEPGTVRMVLSDREFDNGGDQLIRQTRHVVTGVGERPFGASQPAALFAKTGYVLDSASGRTYLAPDADVLLDPTFAQTHCFHVTVDRSNHRGEVGLAFTPVRSRGGIVDVTGTLWMDARSPRLDTLTFRYANIEPAAADAGAGGTVTFTTMANGVVVISRWRLTAPELVPVRHTGYIAPVYLLNRVVRVGGDLTDAAWPDGVRWHEPLASIAGDVERGDSLHAAPGASVWIESLTDTTVTDSVGQFTFGDLLPGTYTLHADDRAIDAFLAKTTKTVPVTVDGGEHATTHIVMLSDNDVARRLCDGNEVSDSTAAVLAKVNAVAGQAVDRLTLRLIWTKPPGSGSGQFAAAPFGSSQQVLPPASRGHFVVCGVTRGGQVSVRGTHGDSTVIDTTVEIPASRGIAIVALVAHHAESPGPAPAVGADSTAATGTIVGYVTDSAGTPVAGVTLTVGRSRATSNSVGDFILRSVPPGSDPITAYKTGFYPELTTVIVPPGGRAGARVILRPGPA